MKKQKLLAGLLALTMALALAACGGEEPAEEEPAAGVAVQVKTVTADTISTENKVSGQVSADNESVILIATAAKCTAVYAQAGDQVQAGDKLCTLDLGSTLSSYNAARISYQAAVQSYQDQKGILDKQVSLAADNVSNTKALFDIGAASQLEAGMQNAKSGVEQLDTALENVDPSGNVLAPQSGTLVTMNATEGSYISNSMPLIVIDGAEQMKVTASVSETLVPKLSAGDTATVYVSAADQTFTATIRSVERAANMQTKLYNVVLTVPADVDGLLNGMFADVTFHTDVSENTIVVPTEAILTSNDVQYVYVVESDTAKYVEVTTGLTGSGVTEVTSGLTEGQQLVVVGQAYLADGDPVRVVSGEE